MNPKEIEKEFNGIEIDDSDDESEVNSENGDNVEENEDRVEEEDDDNETDDDDADVEDEEIGEEDLNMNLNDERQYASDQEEEGEEEDEEEEEDENYLQKFESKTKKNIIEDYHPEMKVHNQSEIDLMSIVVRNEDGVIIDPLHITLPFITKYEKTRIIGERSRQLDAGAIPFVNVEPEIIDGYLIALDEFQQKKIPFIIKRPLPNGSCEYWKVSDLEII
jgi:DNA-directed RNA polymerase I, II, and III subunit RPABC2